MRPATAKYAHPLTCFELVRYSLAAKLIICSLTMSSSLVNVLAIFLRTSGEILGTCSQYSPISHRMLALAIGTWCTDAYSGLWRQSEMWKWVVWIRTLPGCCRWVWPCVWWCRCAVQAASAEAFWSPPLIRPQPALKTHKHQCYKTHTKYDSTLSDGHLWLFSVFYSMRWTDFKHIYGNICMSALIRTSSDIRTNNFWCLLEQRSLYI